MCRGKGGCEPEDAEEAHVAGREPLSLLAYRDSLLRRRKEPPLPHLAGIVPARHPHLTHTSDHEVISAASCWRSTISSGHRCLVFAMCTLSNNG